jgi:hypothetical protein
MLFPSFGPPITQEDIAKMGEDSAKTLQSRLDKGDTYLFFSNGLELSFGRMKGAKDLQLMCQVLASDRNKESKLAILQRMGILPVGNDQLVASLLTDFHVTEQLALRIKELEDISGIKSLSENPISSFSVRQSESMCDPFAGALLRSLSIPQSLLFRNS